MDARDVFTIVVLVASILPLGLFMYFYGSRPAPGKWYRRRFSKAWMSSGIGWVLMLENLSLISLLAFILIVRWTGDFPARPWIALGLYFILVGLFWAVFLVLRGVQKSTEEQEQLDIDASLTKEQS